MNTISQTAARAAKSLLVRAPKLLKGATTQQLLNTGGCHPATGAAYALLAANPYMGGATIAVYERREEFWDVKEDGLLPLIQDARAS